MAPQRILFYLGVFNLVLAAAFAAWAGYTFFSLDVRGVMDDLSGRRRAQGVAAVPRRRRSSTTPRGPVQPIALQGPTRDRGVPLQKGEDKDMETLVGEPCGFAPRDASPPRAGRGTDSACKSSVFKLTRSVVLVHSEEVV